MQRQETWKALAKFYKDKFNYPEHIVEYLSCREILLNCCKGYSSQRISYHLGINRKRIDDVIYHYFNFTGWTRDLDYSPIAIYNHEDVKEDKLAYELFIIQNFIWESDKSTIDLSYFLCSKLAEYEKELYTYES